MRLSAWLLLGVAGVGAAQAQDLADTCRASSSYDLTVTPDRLRFERATPVPRRIELGNGKLEVDGAPLRLNAEQVDRVALFEHELRALVPKAKAVAQDGVDLGVQALRAEAASLRLSVPTVRQLDAKLAARSAELKQRIAASTSTREWHDEAFERWIGEVVADIQPLIADDLATQAFAAVALGDLEAAAALRDRAAALAADLRPRLERRMQALRPRIAALCPSIRHLQELQHGLRGENGRALDLVEIAGKR